MLQLTFRQQPDSSANSPRGVSNSKTVQRPGNLHLLIPASKPDVNLCKLLLGAATLGYPSPVLINYNETFDEPGLVAGGSHLAKIAGVHRYVANLHESHDEDIVLMVDGFDVWMQLRPQTLLDRYYDLTRRGNERIESVLGTSVARERNIRQQVIFGCQKRCWPWNPEDPPCYAVPNSTLPRDIYGARTDTPSGEEYPFQNNRPRFLVSGTAIGPVRAFRRLFDQALEQVKTEPNFGSDQYIFSHIFGDQEIWREAVRRDTASYTANLWRANSVPGRHFKDEHIQQVRQKAAARPDQAFEFGIGIDYESSIVLNTVFAEDDTEWLTFSDSSSLLAAQNDHLVPNKYRTTTLSPDVADALPPFWTFSVEKFPRWTSWTSIPLFTNIFTAIQPAIIHHNAHRSNLKSLRETWWPKIWYYRYGRRLYDAYIYAPVTPVAFSGGREWWAKDLWKGGARVGGGATDGSESADWVRFDEVCRPWHEELFGDGGGEWMLPDNH